MTIHLLDPARLDGAAEVLALTAERRIRAAGSIPPPSEELRRLATGRLTSALEDPRRRTFLAVDAGGTAQAVLGGIFTHLRPEDVEYTYMAPDHVLCPVGAWSARDDDAAAQHLPGLLAALRTAAAEDGIDRVNVQVLDAEWWSVAVWTAVGLRPDAVYGLRPLQASMASRVAGDGVSLRPAEPRDLDALVRLSEQ